MTMYSVHMGLVFPCSVGLLVTHQLADPGGGGGVARTGLKGGGGVVNIGLKEMPGSCSLEFFLSIFHVIMLLPGRGGGLGNQRNPPNAPLGGCTWGLGPPFSPRCRLFNTGPKAGPPGPAFG